MFSVGQLVSVTNLPEGDDRYGFLGRIGAVNGDNVTVVAYDGNAVVVEVGSIKRATHYDVDEAYSIREGEHAHVHALDHPDEGGNLVITTNVIKVDIRGFFETKNTVYVPHRINSEIFGPVPSPYLE